VALVLALRAYTTPALAIMSGEESPLATFSDADYTAGKTAFRAGNW